MKVRKENQQAYNAGRIDGAEGLWHFHFLGDHEKYAAYQLGFKHEHSVWRKRGEAVVRFFKRLANKFQSASCDQSNQL